MRVRAVALSLVVHAVLLALIAQVRRRVAEREEAVEVEVAEAPVAEPARADEPAAAEVPRADEPAAAEVPHTDEPAAAEVPHTVEPAEPETEPRAAGRAHPAPPAPPAGGATTDTQTATGGMTGELADDGLGLGWSLGALGSGSGGSGGGGSGGGGSRGAGGGRGAGGRGGAGAARARPAPRQVSKARPPRLVYPKRFRDERDGEVFVALLTIDEGGWVVGVRLVKGVSPFADQKALDAVWRFHYDPALDQAGRPIRARVEQRFMVD